jgi:transcriptional regulator ATRX
MVSFVTPNLLGSLAEFKNGFDNPIRNGQHKDSTREDVIRMKMRAHVLHQRLDAVVNRKDFSVIRSFLPPKNEYVLSIRLCELQIDLYKIYLARIRRIQVINLFFLEYFVRLSNY